MTVVTDIGALQAELERTQLAAEVAIDLVPLLDSMVESHDARRLVVDDMVECWLRLEPAVRKGYSLQVGLAEPPDPPVHGLLSCFVEHYVDNVEHDIFAAPSWSPTFLGKRADQFCRDGWMDFEDALRARLAAGEPPPDEWLVRFPPKVGDLYTADGYMATGKGNGEPTITQARRTRRSQPDRQRAPRRARPRDEPR